jgi:hypothetical protein
MKGRHAGRRATSLADRLSKVAAASDRGRFAAPVYAHVGRKTVGGDRLAVGDLDAGVADASKVFQHIGRFLPLAELPPAAIAHVAEQLYQATAATLTDDRRTLYRHHHAIRLYLGITPWGPRAQGIACEAIAAAAQARIDPADLANAAIDALIRESCELPLLSTLRTLVRAAHRLVNATQGQQVYERLSDADTRGLDQLLTPSGDT